MTTTNSGWKPPTVAKPPLGVTPEHIWVEQRVIELRRAISDYMAAGRAVKAEWVEEYNRHIESGS